MLRLIARVPRCRRVRLTVCGRSCPTVAGQRAELLPQTRQEDAPLGNPMAYGAIRRSLSSALLRD